MKLSLSARLSSKDRKRFDAAFTSINERFDTMSAQLDALAAQVAATNTVMASAVTLIQGLAAEVAAVKAELAAIGVTNERLNELATALDTGDDALAQAILDNTTPPAEAQIP